MPHIWNELFDGVYCLNLSSRPERYATMEKRFAYFDLKVERANALPGTTIQGLWTHIQDAKSPGHHYFTNPNYLACAIGHLNIYARALARGQKKILVIEDDVRIARNSEEMTKTFMSQVPSDWDMLYFSYIPLSDDQTMWTYEILDNERLSQNVTRARNLWSMMGLVLNERMMRHMLDVYARSFPMEIDRYLVEVIQKSEEFHSYAINPQAIVGEDIYSDNAGGYCDSFAVKSLDTRFAAYSDYI
jgi:GR25 family glycosyltransferase involved in LPS biosynthesis